MVAAREVVGVVAAAAVEESMAVEERVGGAREAVVKEVAMAEAEAKEVAQTAALRVGSAEVSLEVGEAGVETREDTKEAGEVEREEADASDLVAMDRVGRKGSCGPCAK